MFSWTIPFLVFVAFFWLLSQVDVFFIKLSHSHRFLLLSLALCILMVFAGGRWSHYEVGYDMPIFDYSTYKNVYLSPLNIFYFGKKMKNANYEIRSMEPGYVFYSSFCSLLFGSHYNLYLLFTNILLVVLFFKSLKNNEIKKAYLFLFFFLAVRLYLQYHFILLRQAIALSIIWAWGFPCIVRGERAKFVLYVLMAATFHFTALISLAALVFKRSFNVIYCVLGFVVLLVLNLTGVIDQLFLSLMQKGVAIAGFPDALGEKVAKYVQDDEGRSLNMLTFIEAIPFGYIAMRYKRKLCCNPFGRFYHHMFYVFILLLALTMNFGFLTRACQYFMFSYFFLLAFYFQTARQTMEKKLFLFLLSCYFLVYSVRYIFIWFYDTEYSFFLFEI